MPSPEKNWWANDFHRWPLPGVSALALPSREVNLAGQRPSAPRSHRSMTCDSASARPCARAQFAGTVATRFGGRVAGGLDPRLVTQSAHHRSPLHGLVKLRDSATSCRLAEAVVGVLHPVEIHSRVVVRQGWHHQRSNIAAQWRHIGTCILQLALFSVRSKDGSPALIVPRGTIARRKSPSLPIFLATPENEAPWHV